MNPIRRVACAVLWLCASPIVMAQTTQWTGATSSQWTLPSNWSAGVPNAGTDAVVTGSGRAPLVTTTTAACRNLTVQSGTLRVDGRLSVHGSLTTTTDLSGTGAIRMAGTTPTGTVSANGRTLPTLEVTGGRDVVVDGPDILGDLLCYTAGAGSVRLQGNVVVRGATRLVCTRVSAAAGTTVRLLGNAELRTVVTTTYLGDTITLGGDFTSDASLQLAGGDLRFVGSRDHTVVVPGGRLWAVTVDPGEALVAAATLQIGSDLRVVGSLSGNAHALADVTLRGTTTNAFLEVDGSLTVEPGASATGILLLHGSANLGSSLDADVTMVFSGSQSLIAQSLREKAPGGC